MEHETERATVRALPLSLAYPVALPTALLILALAGLVLLAQLGGVTSTGYDLRRLQNERANRERENQMLESYVADLQSLERVERVAVDRLKMIPAQDRVFLRVPGRPATSPIGEEAPPGTTVQPNGPVRQNLQVRIGRWLASWLAEQPSPGAPGNSVR